jgi:tetratricopeptide (TPR) repeat protein
VLYGFGDGIYSTMWGDSFYGGISSWENRPAWNYTLMAAGFLLSLLPTLIILTGFVVCAVKFLHRPEPVWFLLLGLTVTTYAALFYMSLKLPYFCNVKAFYALITLLPMCAFGAAGWKVICDVAGKLRPVLYVAALVWAMNAYASFWIRDGSSATRTMRANLDSRRGRPGDAIAELTEALRINPHDVVAMRFLAAEQARAGNVDAAWQTTKLLLADDPDNASGLLQAALLLAQNGQMDAALQKGRRAIEVAPDYALAYQELAAWLSQTGKNKEAADAAREGLRITPFNPQLHALLAASLTKLGEQTEADEQLSIAKMLAASHR